MPLCITSGLEVYKIVTRPEEKKNKTERLTHSRRYQPQKGFLLPPYPHKTFYFHVLPAFQSASSLVSALLPRGSFITQRRQWTIMDHCSGSMCLKGHSSAMFLPPLTSHPAISTHLRRFPHASVLPVVGLNLHAGIISTAHRGWSLKRK